MGNKIKIGGMLVLISLLIAGWDFHPKASATVPNVNELISVSSSGTLSNNNGGGQSSLSADGRFVAFSSNASNLVASDTNSASDVFVRDRVNHTTTLVSVSSSGTQGNAASGTARITPDGRYVVFDSYATNLVANDTNGYYDIFLRDLQSGTTTLVSVSSSGTQGNQSSTSADVSADGRFVVFLSTASNLVSGVNPYGIGQQVFMKDLQTGALKALSVTSTGTQGNASASTPRIDCDGGFVVFASAASNLVSGDTNGVNDAFLYSNTGWSGGTLTNVTKSGNGSSGVNGISCDGRKLLMSTSATNLTPRYASWPGGMLVYDRLNGDALALTVNSTGNPFLGGGGNSSISDDGRYVVFQSDEGATLLPSQNFRITYSNIFVKDMKTGVTQLVSLDQAGRGAGASAIPAISLDGTYVTYQTAAEEQMYDTSTAIVLGDNNGKTDTVGSQTGLNP